MLLVTLVSMSAMLMVHRHDAEDVSEKLVSYAEIKRSELKAMEAHMVELLQGRLLPSTLRALMGQPKAVYEMNLCV